MIMNDLMTELDTERRLRDEENSALRELSAARAAADARRKMGEMFDAPWRPPPAPLTDTPAAPIPLPAPLGGFENRKS